MIAKNWKEKQNMQTLKGGKNIIKSLMKRFSLHRKVTCFLWWDYLNIYNKQINRLHINLKIVTMTKNEGGKIIEW